MINATVQTAPALADLGLFAPRAPVRTLSGTVVPYLDADAAATTPPLLPVAGRLQEFLATYGSVHRGSGAHSRRSTALFTLARQRIVQFLGADPAETTVCITANTTAAINKLRRKLDLRYEQGDRVFLGQFEHSSNDLAWRVCQPVRIPATADGTPNLELLEQQLRAAPPHGRKLVCVAGASNLTGRLAPLKQIAALAHRYAGWLFVDAAQLVAHRAIRMGGTGHDDHIDLLAFSGHKMYAPYGAGMLVGRREILGTRPPDDLGGGTVDFVTPHSFDLSADDFRRENPGTPNAPGVVAIALAAAVLEELVGFAAIERHERELLETARRRLPAIDRLRVLGPADYDAARQCAVLSFVMDGVEHGLLAARLSHEFGIGVRQGHLCQFAHVARLLGLAPPLLHEIRRRVVAGQPEAMYGVVRASFGLHNTAEDVARIATALEEIAATPQRHQRYVRTAAGDWIPRALPTDKEEHFFHFPRLEETA